MFYFIKENPLISVLIAGLVLSVLFIFFAAGMAIKESVDHDAYLKEHGCQVMISTPTGRRDYCGKGCWHNQTVVVYDCADGQKVELQ